LLTVQEKHWDTERRGLSPRPAERNRIRRELTGEIFSDAKLRTFRYRDLRTFRLAVFADDEPVEPDGQIRWNVVTAEDASDDVGRRREARAASAGRQDEIFWVACLTEEIHHLVEEL